MDFILPTNEVSRHAGAAQADTWWPRRSRVGLPRRRGHLRTHRRRRQLGHDRWPRRDGVRIDTGPHMPTRQHGRPHVVNMPWATQKVGSGITQARARTVAPDQRGIAESRLSESNRRPSHYEEERHRLVQPLPAPTLTRVAAPRPMIPTD